MRNALLSCLLVVTSACMARDFGICINGTTRQGDSCEYPDDAGEQDGQSDGEDGGDDPDAGPDAAAPADASTPEGDGGPQTCTSSDECDAEAPVCETEGCSSCRTNNDCARFASVALPACGSAGACVECTENAHCLNPEKPVCGSNNTCEGPCTSDLDCERPGSSAWATPHCELGGGVCVACIPGALEEEQCTNGNACDPTSFTCSGELRKSVGTCGSPITPSDERVIRCISDTECVDGHKCVQTQFKGEPYGSYCLLMPAGGSGSCTAPWPRKLAATSVGGISAEFCFPRDLLATCEAVLDFGSSCTTNSDCGRDGVEDGHCESNRCTYACSGPGDCNGSACTAFPAGQFCNPN